MRTTLILALAAALACAAPARAATSVTQYGITWNFDDDYTVGQYANLDYYVVAPSGLNLTSITPSDLDGTGYKFHGTEINPSPRGGSTGQPNDQGWESRIPALYSGRPAYSATRDVSDNMPLFVAAGSSIVSTISVGTIGSDDLGIDVAAVLTVVSSAPPAGSFRPPYCGTDKTSYYNESRLNYDFFPDLQITSGISSTMPSLATAAGWFAAPQLDVNYEFGNSAIKARQSGANYGADMSEQSGTAALLLSLNYTNAQKRTLLINFIQRGIDIDGLYRGGQRWHHNGGHHQGRKLTMLVAGMVLGDSAIVARCDGTLYQTRFQEDMQHFIVAQIDVDTPRTGQSTPYAVEDIGMPEWAADVMDVRGSAWNSWDADYRSRTGSTNTTTVLAADLLGLRDEWNWEPFFRYVHERYWPIEGARNTGSNQISDFTQAYWGAYSGLLQPQERRSPSRGAVMLRR